MTGRSLARTVISRTYTRLVNLISGHRVKYYNGLAIHRRYNVMRWHPNTRGFGFQAELICTLLDRGASYVEISVPAEHRPGSNALTIRNFLSVAHTLLGIAGRSMARLVFGK